MKKSLRKVISAILVLGLAGSMLMGCGKTATESATGESAATDAATFYVGGIGPITGGAAIYGQAVKNGAELAVDEINAAGGVNGTMLAFNFQDDEHDAEKALNAYNTLKDWGMQILMGTVTSTPCKAVAAETVKDNMYQLTPSGSSVDCVTNANAFQVCFSDPNQGIASAQYIGENALANKVAVIYDSSDVYSSGIYEKFVTESTNQNFEVVAAEAFTADSKTDFSVQLQKAKEAGAELVFLPIYYTEAAIILKQADTAGYAPQFFGCDGLDGILTSEGFDATLAENVMLLTPFAADAQDELTKKFVADYQTAYGEVPNQFAADAYDAMYIIKAAIEAGKVTPDMSTSDICDAMVEAMKTLSVDGLTGEKMTWDENGMVNKAPKAVKIVNGAYTAM